MSVPEKFTGYAAKSKGAELEQIEFTPAPLGTNDITVKVLYCGVCYSDVHMIDSDWFPVKYPIVAGHEVVGEVVELGPSVSSLQKGQIVGIGWNTSSCMNCEYCDTANDQFCSKKTETIVNREGGFANYVRCSSTHAFPIPKELPLEVAGPLLCGGITVFTPFTHFNIRPGDNVAIYGIGGLGHLGLQFAKARGCQVTAISGSADKEEEARKFGANVYVNTNETGALKKIYNSLDAILVTGASGDWNTLLKCLKVDGKLIFLGAGTSELQGINVSSIYMKRLTITGSLVGSRADIKEMLQFAANNKVYPQINLYQKEKINDGIKFLREGKARYRVVIQF